ncbi:hypothetical protein [Saccharolobus caldissimus]|uniref:Uncharacterized protein n=1 Tax=Saccharolobus caldissimus TaxID=1702097 RepID=A0AAQ4CRV5_9CREN|nr:hypothetical protein [Saccharolobus caldissimus]BDB98536.1 hypothetical protein SACC_15530 [Saccharolobus caldissimus]
MEKEVSSEEVYKKYRSLVKVFRFYVVLRKFGYIDPLIYSIDPAYIKDVITQALREYVSYLSSATVRKVKVIYKKENKEAELPCLVVMKNSEIPQTFISAYPDVVHPVISSDEVCIAPIYWKKDGSAGVVHPRSSVIKDFLDKLDSNIQYVRILISLAVGG